MVSPRSLPVPVVALLAVVLLGCSSGRDAPLRSPTRDYQPPPPQTSDGRVVGVDNKPPADHIDSGLTTGHLAGGWERDDRVLLRYHPHSTMSGSSGWERSDKGRPRYNPQRRMDGLLQESGVAPAGSARAP